MAGRNCFALLHSTLLVPNYGPGHSSPKPLFSTLLLNSKPSVSIQICELRRNDSNTRGEDAVFSVCLSKRELKFSFLAVLVRGVLQNMSNKALLAEEMELQRYTDSKQGFTLLRPSSWKQVEKAGATALFEEANMGSNSIGVVVSPVRLTSLGEFGSPQFVADKLILAEKRKESTKEAEVIGVAERLGKGGLQVYEFEYKVDSTRGGMKRIFSAAFVTSKKLYLLNISHSDKPESPLGSHKRKILEQVFHSFDAAPLT